MGREARLMAARASIGAQRGGLRRAMYGAVESRTDLPALLTFRVPPSGYHEIIVDARSLEVHLPDTVLAFFYPSNGAGKNTAARAREAFLREYPEVQPDSLPLLRYNPALKEEPFEAD